MASHPAPHPRMLFGIGLKVASTLVFTVMAAFVKLASASFPVAEIVFFRSILALVVLVGWLWWRGDFPRALHTHRVSGHILRGVVGALSMFMGFSTFGLLPLPDATAIGYATSLIIVLFAAMVLHERVGPARWAAVAVGFLGVLVTLWENLGGAPKEFAAELGIPPGLLIGAICTFWCLFTAAAMLQTRRLAQTEETAAIVFWFQSTTTATGAIVMLIALVWPQNLFLSTLVRGQAWVMPDLVGAGILVTLGVLGGLGQIWMTQSFRYCDASVVACFDYASLIWALMLGIFVFDEIPGAWSLTGVAIIAGAGLFLIWRERRSMRGLALST
jgi:drug/metabolite transporter (DMT)-like permease